MSDGETRSERGKSADLHVLRSAQPTARKLRNARIRIVPLLITLATTGLAAVLGWAMWQAYMGAPWTRDGTVRTYVVQMAPEVAGRIVELPVIDNQFVHKGDLLLEIEPTDYGFRLITLRQISDAKAHVRVTNLIFPNAFIIPMSREMTISQWHVPIDDEKHYWYAIFTSFGAPVNKDEMRRQRLELYQLPDYIPNKNKNNDYGFDPHEQEHETYTGMGADINVHDQWACESMGAIQDRTNEHLGTSDKAISAYRKLLRQAIEQSGKGEKPIMVLDRAKAASITGPAAIDGIGPVDDWQGYWQKTEAVKRKAASWANGH